MKPAELRWIETGYHCLGELGPPGVKIDTLAKMLGVARSSFYHHFFDWEIFMELLLQHHCNRGLQLAHKVKACKSMDGDFLELLQEHQNDLFVNRQLRIHRNNPAYLLAFQHANALVRDAILPVWAGYIQQEKDYSFAAQLFDVMADLFYQRIVPGKPITSGDLQLFLVEFAGLIGILAKQSGLVSAYR
jgi:AcrR family transcriptional regulator